MFATLHALALLLIAGIIPIILLYYRKIWWQRFPGELYLFGATLVVGAIFSMLLLVQGTPLLEWLLPALGAAVSVACIPNLKMARGMACGMFVAAIVLCFSFVGLVTTDYSTATALRQSLVSTVNAVAIKKVARQLSNEHDPLASFPAGPVENIDPKLSRNEVSVLKTRRLWHTCFTRLHELHKQPAAVWYPGGTIQSAVAHLEVRAD